MHSTLEPIISKAFQEKQEQANWHASEEAKQAINETIEKIDQGELRVAEKIQGEWQTHAWLKQAVLLYFATHDNTIMPAETTHYFDKVPSKFDTYTQAQFQAEKVRVVPPAMARKGAYIGPNCVLMPSYVNIGAYVDSGTMVDTWATVGSCAQIGKNVHLSGGVGIGGVLEPLQATPTIIEDNCFIGARSEIVEGVIVEQGAVISMGVFISQSTPIYDRETKTISYGRVPENAVVIAGSLPSKDGCYHRNAAIIVKRADARTRSKTSINDLLRDL